VGGVFLGAQPSLAQETPVPNVHWAYASFFGTGWYKVSNQQSAFIANFAPRWTSGDTGWSKVADREAVYTVRVPVTVGVARLDFEDVPGILDPENFSTVSAGLRADLDLPVTARLSVRPNIQLSYGTVIGENDHAWTYRGDVRGRYSFEAGNLGWALIGAAGFVGYDASRGTDDSFTYAALGAEFDYPVRWFSSAENQTLLYWHVLYTDFLNRVEVRSNLDQTVEVANYWQAGVAFGKKDKLIQFWFLKFDRLGLAYDVSPSGELRGVKFVFRSLYEP
jgi:hypothetical protein